MSIVLMYLHSLPKKAIHSGIAINHLFIILKWCNKNWVWGNLRDLPYIAFIPINYILNNNKIRNASPYIPLTINSLIYTSETIYPRQQIISFHKTNAFRISRALCLWLTVGTSFQKAGQTPSILITRHCS